MYENLLVISTPLLDETKSKIFNLSTEHLTSKSEVV